MIQSQRETILVHMKIETDVDWFIGCVLNRKCFQALSWAVRAMSMPFWGDAVSMK